jgi:hypothetical protein
VRYIKTYKLFESYFQNDFINDIKDITLDLSDEGFEVYVHEVDYTPTDKSGSIKAIAVDLKPSNMFRWSDIKDSVERIEEYCWRKDEGYEIDVEVVSYNEFIDLNQFISIYGGEEIESDISLLIYSVKDYLEKYGDYGMNESVIVDEIQNVNDILMELKDENWSVNCYYIPFRYTPETHHHLYNNDYINVVIKKNQNTSQSKYPPNSEFVFSDIEDYVYRVLDYYKDNKILSFELIEHDPYYDDKSMIGYKTGIFKEIEDFDSFKKQNKPILGFVIKVSLYGKNLDGFKYPIKESIEVRQYIDDILLPLEDDGFEIKIQDTGTSTSFFIGNNPNGYITKSEIKAVEHLYSYLTEMGYKPYGKNILDDLDINFKVFSSNNTKTMMYKRFIHFLENTDSKVNWIKFSFWNEKN